jgi:two-component system phosphate regulon sensor histidine kinase PhoR
MLDILRRNAEQLNNRVMEIINEESRLQALTIDEPVLQLEGDEVDLWPIAERLRQDCQPIAASRHNWIRNDVPHGLRVFADPDLLLEAFKNLLSNALKYTADGEIVIGAEEDKDATVCRVSDTGIGISPERIDHIFKKGTSDPDIAESTGLGLAIVEKVMQLHRGTISVESTPGAGSTFRMKFPKKQSKAA